MKSSRPLDSGRRDVLGRRVMVSGADVGVRADAPPPPDDRMSDTDWELLASEVSRIAKGVAKAFGVDPDDLGSEMMVSIAGMEDRSILREDLVAVRSYMWVVAKHAGSRMSTADASTVSSSRWYQAKEALRKATENADGRLSPSELDELAATIEVSGSRLPPGWHRFSVERPGALNETLATTDGGVGVDDDDVDIEVGDGSKWEQFVEVFDAPAVRPDMLSEHLKSQVRRRVADAGGVAVLLERWRDESLDRELEDALFVPFGTLRDDVDTSRFWPRWVPPSFDDQVRLVDALSRLDAGQADVAWQTAVMEASQRRER